MSIFSNQWLKNKGRNLCLDTDLDVGEADKVQNDYFACVFTKKENIEDSGVSLENTNMQAQFSN